MLLLNRTLLKMSKGLWGWMLAIVALKMAALVWTTTFAKTISQFLGNIDSPSLTAAQGRSAVISALIAAGLMFLFELLAGEAEYRCTAKARTNLRQRIFSKVLELDVGNIERVGPVFAITASVDGVESMQVYYSKYLPGLLYCICAPVYLFFQLYAISLPVAVILLAAAVLLLSCVPVSVGAAKTKLYVFNCGDYIADTTIEKFETAYPEYEVVYEVFDTNEAMYQKLVSSNIPYDVLIPSDYMIERLIKENRLKEIDMTQLENYHYIGEAYKNTSYDPENKYSVPYMWGTLGILYNKEKVDDVVDSWSILWNEKYKGQILMLDSMRDSMAVALEKLGYSMNTTNEAEINAAAQALIEQKPLVAEYGVENLQDKKIEGT